MKGSSFMDFMSAAKRQFDLYKLFQKCLKTYKKIHSIPHRSLPVLNSQFVLYLFAGEPHKHISHDALPLALEHTFLKSMKELKVLLDQKPQRAGKRTEDTEKDEESDR